MRAIFGLVLVLGVALAGFAVYMAQSYLGQSEARLKAALQQQAQTGKLVQVYAVKKAMKFGDPLLKENVQKVWLQEKLLPPGTFAKEEVLFPPHKDKPRLATRSMEANEVLLASRVTEPGEIAGLAGKLEKGVRAYQIRVSVASGVASFVMPDDLIDVYWTGAVASGDVTRMIESGLRIIAVDQSADQSERSDGAARTVTVAVTPEQVARLAQAQATGKLTMSLMGSNDDPALSMVEIDRNALLGVETTEAVVVETPVTCSVRTRKGDSVVETPIPCTN